MHYRQSNLYPIPFIRSCCPIVVFLVVFSTCPVFSFTLHTGTLTQCYDTLGNHYAIPKYCLSAPTNIIQAEKTVDESLESPDGGGDGEESQSLINAVEIKLRLSTMKDVKVQIGAKSAVRDLKKKLYQQEGIEPQKVRLLFSGRVLKDDDCIEDLKIPKGFVIQALVSS